MVDRDDSKVNDGDDFLDELNELLDDALDGEPQSLPIPSGDIEAHLSEDSLTAAEPDEGLGEIQEHQEDLLDWNDDMQLSFKELDELQLEAEPDDTPRGSRESDELQTVYSADDDGTVPIEEMQKTEKTNTNDDLTHAGKMSESSLESSWNELELELATEQDSTPPTRVEPEPVSGFAEEPLSYAARIAAASYPDLAARSSNQERLAESEPDFEQGTENKERLAELHESELPAQDEVSADVETDADLDFLDDQIAQAAAKSEEFHELNEFDVPADDPSMDALQLVADESASAEEATRMPFETRQPTELEKSVLVPAARPEKKRSSPIEGVKLLLALVMLAFTTQMALWWGFGADPLGLAHVVPGWLLPTKIQLEVAEVFKGGAPLTPPAPNPAPVEESSPDEAEPPAADTGSADLEPPTAPVADESTSPAPNSADQEFEPPGGTPVDTTVPPSTDLGLNSGTSDFEPEQPAEASTSAADETLAELEPPAEQVPAIEPDTLLNELGEGNLAHDNANEGDVIPDAPTGVASAPNREMDAANSPSPSETAEGDIWSASSPTTAMRPIGAPTFSSDDLISALGAARDADLSLTDARVNRAPDLIKKAEQFYRSFSQLAVTGTYLGRDEADEALNSVRDLLRSFEFDEKKQRMIANAARNWMKANLGDGVLAAVTISDISRKGTLYEVKASLMGKEATPVTLLTSMDPGIGGQLGFQAGDRILVLGTLVQEPGRKIDGYSGAATTVVWFTDLAVALP